MQFLYLEYISDVENHIVSVPFFTTLILYWKLPYIFKISNCNNISQQYQIRTSFVFSNQSLGKNQEKIKRLYILSDLQIFNNIITKSHPFRTQGTLIRTLKFCKVHLMLCLRAFYFIKSIKQGVNKHKQSTCKGIIQISYPYRLTLCTV